MMITGMTSVSKITQTPSDMVRQTSSLAAADAKNNTITRFVRMRHPCSSIGNIS